MRQPLNSPIPKPGTIPALGPYRPRPFRIRGSEAEGDERPWHWTRTIMLIGLFGCLISFATVASWTMLSRTFLSQTIAFFCILGLLLFPFRFYQRFLDINAFETLLFNVMGIGPLIFSSLLWINFLFHGTPVEETHRIEARSFIGQMLNPVYEYQLKDAAYGDMAAYRQFPVTPGNQEKLERAVRVHYRTAKGALGYRVMLEREPLR